MRKSHTTITRHQEDKQSKATSSLFTIKMIAKQELTQSNAQQKVEQLQNPTMGVTINNQTTTTVNSTTALERTAAKATWGGGGGGGGGGGDLNAFYWYLIFALDSAVVEEQKCKARMEDYWNTEYSILKTFHTCPSP